MAVYKVIQDVEAEDKLLGPLTFKGLVYAGIAVFCLFINYKLLMIGTPLKWLFIFMFMIPAVLFGVLASPLGREQPTEVWLLSKIRFFLKPRLRIWDQMGMAQLVDVTAPKRLEEHLTKDLTQSEVQSRLKALAVTLDTRGWAVKNINVNLDVAPDPRDVPSDRLVSTTIRPQQAAVADVQAADDIMDEQNNPTAQKVASLMHRADTKRKRALSKTVKVLTKKDEEEAKNILAPETDKLNKRLADAISKFDSEHTHAKDAKPAITPAPPAAAPTPVVTEERQAANMELAQSGSAFSVATLSQLANRQPQIQQSGPNEVTVSLH
ncbi:MAG TPA: PrgI family protein [Candidatus Saccharimonadales bacterium]|nr:PrgI family protein [Candidatus Saccharimonadales bacterium]